MDRLVAKRGRGFLRLPDEHVEQRSWKLKKQKKTENKQKKNNDQQLSEKF
jgi:hypothetical protein